MTYNDFFAEWHNDGSDFVTAHTSGSTGSPKPVCLLKTDMLLSARATNQFFGIQYGDLLVSPLAADYIAGKMMAVRALDSGARLVVEPPSRSPLSSLQNKEHVKLVAVIPQQIDGLIASDCSVENVIVGGAPTPPEVEARAIASWTHTYWWATYGMTETCSHVALRRFGEREYHALPGVEFSTTDDSRLIIIQRGASWSPVVTNDIVTLVNSTSFIFQGRADNAIISGGIKIHPEEVESLIASALTGYRYYISSRQSDRWGAEPVLVIEGTPPSDGGQAILDNASKLAGRIQRPKAIIWLNSLPLTDSGKIKRRTF